MICTKCGARLMENDQFCPKCGARVIKEKRCPDCGAVLRDGIKFCPECGRPVGVKRKAKTPVVSDETLDIPIEAIERNILSETAAEIKGRRTESASRRAASMEREPVRRASSGNTSEKRASSGGGTSRSAPAKRVSNRSSVPAPAPRRKKPVYREEVWEEDDNWEDEDDWEEDGWDDDDDEGIDAITIMTVVVGCVLLIVVAFLGYRLYRQYVPKNYEKAAEEQQEEQEEGQEQDTGEDEEPSSGAEITDGQDTYTLVIDSNVNVRAEPSTSSDKLKVAQAGETYTCRGTAGDGTWYEIILEDGSTGYVFQDYVSVE